MYRHPSKNIYSTLVFIAIVIVGGVVYFAFFQNKMGISESISPDTKLASRNNTNISHLTMGNSAKIEESVAGVLKSNDNMAGVSTVDGCGILARIFSSQPEVGVKEYIVSITNAGTVACTNVNYSIYYSDSEYYSSALPKPKASDYYWSLGRVVPGAAPRVTTIRTKTDAPDQAGIELCVTSDSVEDDVCVSSINIITSPATTTVPAFIPAVIIPKQTPTNMTNTTSTAVPGGKEFGVWVWNSPVTMSDTVMDTVISQADTAGFNVIYVSVDDVANYKTADYTKALAKFVTKANVQGIAVDALAGASTWAQPKNRINGFKIIDYLITYNANNPKIRGFQFDVEPYLLPMYEKNKAVVLTEFVDFIDLSAQKLALTDMRFAVVIPHFYDSAVAWTPKVTSAGITDHTYNHLLRILDKKEGNAIIIMAYRDYFSGKNGIEDISKSEVVLAGKTKVIIAQETGNYEPNYITHYGQSRANLDAVIGQINANFGVYEGFGGVAVHHLETFLALP